MFLNNNAMFTLVIEGVFNDFDEVVYERLVTAIAHAEDIKYDPETEYCLSLIHI